MSTTRSLSIILPLDMAEMVAAKVTSGEYATESDVIHDGLLTMAEQDAAIEKWLIEEVVPTYEAHHADPSRALSIEEVTRRLDVHMASHKGQKVSRA